MKIRGFEIVEDWARKNKYNNIIMPKRSTQFSAGYDFILAEDLILVPNKPTIYWTDIKAYMLPDEFLALYIRSSMAIKNRIILTNQTGIVDSDFYSNSGTDGNIGISLINMNSRQKTFHKGEKIAQGVFQKYLTIDMDLTNTERTGGVGSTG